MRLREGLVLRKVGDDNVIVDPGQGVVDLSRVFTLNETAAWLWEKIINRDFEVDDLVNLVKEEYDVNEVDEHVIVDDMHALVAFFSNNDLLMK